MARNRSAKTHRALKVRHMDCGHGWRNEVDCDVCRPQASVVASMRAENKQLRTDIEHLLAILDHVTESTGEALDPDDACMVAQIRASPGRTGTDEAMIAGFDAINI